MYFLSFIYCVLWMKCFSHSFYFHTGQVPFNLKRNAPYNVCKIVFVVFYCLNQKPKDCLTIYCIHKYKWPINYTVTMSHKCLHNALMSNIIILLYITPFMQLFDGSYCKARKYTDHAFLEKI